MTNTISRKSVFLTALAACSFCSSVSHAQNGYTTEERIVLDRALTALEDYKTFATVFDEDAYYSFLNLFTDKNTAIFNDLVGVSGENQLKAIEYATLMSGLTSKHVSISNISRDKMWQDENGVWKVQYRFEKSMSYFNKCGIYLSNPTTEDRTYTMTAILAYDKAKNRCLIESIDGTFTNGTKLDKGFYTFFKSNEEDITLRFNGHPMKFNEFGQAYLPANIQPDMFSVSDPDAILTPIIDRECHTVSMGYRALKYNLRVHGEAGMGNAISNGEKSSAWGIGADFGFSFRQLGRVKPVIFVGVGITQTTIDMAYENADFFYTVEKQNDVNGESYIRHYKNLKFDQTAKLIEFTIPVYAEALLRLGKAVALYGDIGVAVNVMMSKKVEMNSGTADGVYGIYPQYNNLHMDYHWGLNGFNDNVSFSTSDIDDSEMSGIKPFSIDALLGAGARINLGQSRYTVDLGVSYRPGLTAIGEATQNRTEPIVYNTVDGMESQEHVANLTSLKDKLTRNLLAIKVGLTYKF